MVKFSARDVELYIAKKGTGTFTPASRGNNTSLAKYVSDKVVDTTLTNFMKISDGHNEVTVSPAENETSTKKYFGTNAGGAQNSDTFVVDNMDIDVTLNIDSNVVDTMFQYALVGDTTTHSTYANYESYNLANRNTEELILLIRVAKQLGGVYYYRNVLIEAPVFKKIGDMSGNADDAVISTEYTLLGNKSVAYVDRYSGTSVETLGTGF